MTTAILTAIILLVPIQDVPAVQDKPTASQPATPQELMAALSIPEVLADAEMLLEQGKISFAARAYNHVILRDRMNIDAILGLARIAETQDDFNTARQYYLKAREIDKTDFRVNYRLGTAYLAIRFYQQALRFLEFAEPLVPTEKAAELKVRMAIGYRGTGARSKAKEYARQAVALDPEDYTAREVPAVALMDDGDFDQARGHIDAMVKIARDRLAEDRSQPGRIQFLLGALGRKLEGLNYYHRSLYEKDPSGQPTDRLLPGQDTTAAASLLPLIKTELQRAELEKILRLHQIITLASRAVEFDPANKELWMTLGLLYLNTSQTSSAIESFQKIIALDPDHAGAADQLDLLNAPLKADPVATQPAEDAPTEP